MTAIVVAPDLPLMMCIRRGILTVPVENASVVCACPGDCDGLDVNSLPLEARSLQLYVLEMGQRFIERSQIRGYELASALRLHGPWPSYEFNRLLGDVESSALKTDDPANALALAMDRNAFSEYADYLLVGNFLKQAVLTEVIVQPAMVRDGIAIYEEESLGNPNA